ncbi:hypothetical protein VTH06DRAFT_7393 [Thermothelomyces fergusii]
MVALNGAACKPRPITSLTNTKTCMSTKAFQGPSMTASCDIARNSRGPNSVTLPALCFVVEMGVLDSGVQICHSSPDDLAHPALERKQLPGVRDLHNGFSFHLNDTEIPRAPDAALCLTSGNHAVPVGLGPDAPETLDKHGGFPTFGVNSDPKTCAYADCQAPDRECLGVAAQDSFKGPKKPLAVSPRCSGYDSFRHPISTVATATPTTGPSLEPCGDGSAQHSPQMAPPAARLPPTTGRHDAVSAFNITPLFSQSEPGADRLFVADTASTFLQTVRMLALADEKTGKNKKKNKKHAGEWERPETGRRGTRIRMSQERKGEGFGCGLEASSEASRPWTTSLNWSPSAPTQQHTDSGQGLSRNRASRQHNATPIQTQTQLEKAGPTQVKGPDLGKGSWVDDISPTMIPYADSWHVQNLKLADGLQFNPDMAEFTFLPWAGELSPPDPFASLESMTGTFANDLLFGGDIIFDDLLSPGLAADAVGPHSAYATPQSSVSNSPATPVYDIIGCFPGPPQIYQPDSDPAPPTPVSLPSATPESGTSPATSSFSAPSTAAGPQPATRVEQEQQRQQVFTCPEPDCGAVFAAHAQLRKHARKHRPRFRCPFAEPAAAAAETTRWCAGGFPDSRALRRHLWSHHAAYARAAGLPSEHARCPLWFFVTCWRFGVGYLV